MPIQFFLQETWLCPNELSLLDNVHQHFNSFSLSSVNLQEEVLVGRPYGGISILWNKSLGLNSNVIQYDDKKILGFSLTLQGLTYLFLNVYLPYYCPENETNYDMYLEKVASIIDGADAAGVVVLDDFNAHINSSFYRELIEMCSSKDLIISILLLPCNTFTHVNNGSLSRSWLDHCISSQSMHNAISNILVDMEYSGLDHFPIYVTFNMSTLPRTQRNSW